MKAKAGDWVLHKSGPHMKVGVVRYVLLDEPFTYGLETYQTDDARFDERAVYEVRSPTKEEVL
jgi:hypothetical protein